MLTAMEGVAFSEDVSDWFSDPDPKDEGGTLTFTATYDLDGSPVTLPGWLELAASTGALTIAMGAANDAEVGVYTLTVTASDSVSETDDVVRTVTLTVENEPEPPVTTGLAPTSTQPLVATEGLAADWDVSDWLTDPDLMAEGSGEVLTYAVSGQPGWLTLTGSMLTIVAEATDDAHVGTHEFQVTATDAAGAMVVHMAVLTVENVNEPPVTTGSAPTSTSPRTAMEGSSASWNVSAWFTDPDLNVPGSTEALTFTVSGNPDWLTLMGNMLNIGHLATDDADVGTHEFQVTATDAAGAMVVHMAVLTVENVNDPPTTTSAAMASLTAKEGVTFSEDISKWFEDPDTSLSSNPDTLTFTATYDQDETLPGWLKLNASTGVLTIATGTTDDEHIGNYTLVVTAMDAAGAMASHTTTLTIEDDAAEPYLSVALSSQILPASGNLTVTLTDFFADLQENSMTDTLSNQFTFEVSESIQGTGAENVVTATVMSTSLLVLEPGAASDELWQQETVTITATDNDGKRDIAEFAVTTRANVLDTSTLDPAHGFIIQGDNRDDALGLSVSGAGDVNGDGLDDLIVGASGGDDGGSGAGEAYIIYGKAGTSGTQFGEAVTISVSVDTEDSKNNKTTTITDGSAPSDSVVRQVLDTTDLAAADGFIIQGDEGGDNLGRSVSGAGDINGDGIDDLIVGANRGDDGGRLAGEAYIVYGKAGTSGTQFGEAVTISVSVDTEDSRRNKTTTITDSPAPSDSVVRRVLDTTKLAPADGFILQGDIGQSGTDYLGDELGTSVSGTGDINGDGLDDLIVGARYGDDGGREAGEAYIIYGKAGTQFGTLTDGGRQVLDTTDLAAADGFILQGDRGRGRTIFGDSLGGSVSGAGDINGDGLADLIVGADGGHDGGNSAGEAYIIYGKAGTGSQFGKAVISNGKTRQVLDTTSLALADGFILQGDATFDALGRSVSGAGDINGDGFDDLIVGAYEGDDGEDSAGEAYIIYGKAGTGSQFGKEVISNGQTRQVLDTTNLASAAGFIIQGDAEDDGLGRSVSGAGDINGDGLADLIVGASGGDDGGMDAGEAYVIYGKAGTQFGEAVTISINTSDSDNHMTTTITDVPAPAGSVVRQVLDITKFKSTDGFILQGDAEIDNLGVSVSGAGDVNGDGIDDLIAEANRGDDGGAQAGEAYVVYGGAHLGEGRHLRPDPRGHGGG